MSYRSLSFLLDMFFKWIALEPEHIWKDLNYLESNPDSSINWQIILL